MAHRILWLFMGYAIALNGPAIGADLPWRVDGWGDFSTLEFLGNSTFATEDIVRALDSQLDLIPAARPSGYLPSLVQKIEAAVQRGYRSKGFPYAQGTVSFNEQRQKLVLTIQEGARFKNGPVNVQGLSTEMTQFLVSRLTESTAAVPVAGTPVKPQGLLLRIGKETDFLIAEERWATRAAEILAQAGYLEARVEAHRKLDPARNLSTLTLTVVPGPAATIGKIEIEGVQRHTAEQVINFLGLALGQPVDVQAIEIWTSQLEESGRFVEQSIVSDPLPQQSGARSLRLSLKECPEVPLLDEELTEVDHLLLQVRKQMPQMLNVVEELQIDFHLPLKQRPEEVSPGGFSAIEVRVNLVKSGNFLISLAGLSDGGQVKAGYLLERGGNGVHLWSHLTGQHLALPATWDGTLPLAYPTLVFLRTASDAPGDRFRVNFGVGVRGGESESDSAPPPAAPPALTMTAAFLLALTRQPETQIIYQDDRILVKDRSLCLKIDRRSARILSAEMASGGVTMFQLTTGSGLLDTRLQQFSAQRASSRAKHDSGPVLARALSFIAGEFAALPESCPEIPPEWTRRIQVGSRLLETLAAVHQSPSEGGTFRNPLENRFRIPPENPAAGGGMEGIASIVLLVNGELLKRGSLSWRVGREALALLVKQDRSAVLELEQIVRNPDAGPLTCLYGAEVLRFVHPMLADLWGRKGLERLDDDSIQYDLLALLDSSTLLGKFSRETSRLLRQFPAEELQALVKDTALELFIPEIRTISGQDSGDQQNREHTLAVTVLLWNQYLRQPVEQSLRRHVREDQTHLKLEIPNLSPVRPAESPLVNKQVPSRNSVRGGVEPPSRSRGRLANQSD